MPFNGKNPDVQNVALAVDPIDDPFAVLEAAPGVGLAVEINNIFQGKTPEVTL
jgi:hypothetical protein